MKYRVRHETRGDGTEYYIPQRKGWFFWHPFMKDALLDIEEKFYILEQAMAFIEERKEADKWTILTNVEHVYPESDK